jgi:hypothetical protein
MPRSPRSSSSQPVESIAAASTYFERPAALGRVIAEDQYARFLRAQPGYAEQMAFLLAGPATMLNANERAVLADVYSAREAIWAAHRALRRGRGGLRARVEALLDVPEAGDCVAADFATTYPVLAAAMTLTPVTGDAAHRIPGASR